MCVFIHVRQKEDQSQLKQFIVHAALDAVEEMQWSTNSLYVALIV